MSIPKNKMPEIIKRIDMLILERNMSKSLFYELSGISSGSFSQWNTGMSSASEKKIKSAAEVLGVSYEYLVNGDENAQQETKTAPPIETDGAVWKEIAQTNVKLHNLNLALKELVANDDDAKYQEALEQAQDTLKAFNRVVELLGTTDI